MKLKEIPRRKIPVFFELLPIDYIKLNKIVESGKYATKVDFVRTKIREEFRRLFSAEII